MNSEDAIKAYKAVVRWPDVGLGRICLGPHHLSWLAIQSIKQYCQEIALGSPTTPSDSVARGFHNKPRLKIV